MRDEIVLRHDGLPDLRIVRDKDGSSVHFYTGEVYRGRVACEDFLMPAPRGRGMRESRKHVLEEIDGLVDAHRKRRYWKAKGMEDERGR